MEKTKLLAKNLVYYLNLAQEQYFIDSMGMG